MLITHRSFTAAALLALALGIGVNNAMLTIYRAMLCEDSPSPRLSAWPGCRPATIAPARWDSRCQSSTTREPRRAVTPAWPHSPRVRWSWATMICRRDDSKGRFAALDPIAQGLERLYGSLDVDVARGLALRMDHGSQYLSDHFLKQIRYWGIHPSFGFVEEPETNGVAERWNRTLKEQAIHGRIFQNLEAVRAAVADFVERYNQTWRLEKLGYQTPIEAREEYELRQAA